MKGPIDLGCWGKVIYGIRGERERKQRAEGSHVCMAVDVKVQPPTGTLPKHPPISSTGAVGAQQAPRLLAVLCVLCSESKQQQLWLNKST